MKLSLRINPTVSQSSMETVYFKIPQEVPGQSFWMLASTISTSEDPHKHMAFSKPESLYLRHSIPDPPHKTSPATSHLRFAISLNPQIMA